MTSGGDPAPRWARDERALWRSGPGNRVLVLGPRDRSPRSLNAAEARVWRAFETPGGMLELADRLAGEPRVDDGPGRHDLQAIVERLTETGALHRLP